MNEAWETFKGYYICINCVSIIATIFKLFGVIGDELPWWFVSGPLILDVLLIMVILASICILMCYGQVYDSIRNKKVHKNSHKKPLVK